MANRDFNTDFAYRPYTGGAGPTKAEASFLTATLLVALHSEGIKAEFEVENDHFEETLFVVYGSRRVCYDRWGYVNIDGNPDKELDQVDLNAAVAYFLEDV